MDVKGQHAVSGCQFRGLRSVPLRPRNHETKAKETGKYLENIRANRKLRKTKLLIYLNLIVKTASIRR